MFIEQIHKRTQNQKADEMEWQAALRGKKIKLPRINVTKTEEEKPRLTESEEKAISARMKESLQKKVLEKSRARASG